MQESNPWNILCQTHEKNRQTLYSSLSPHTVLKDQNLQAALLIVWTIRTTLLLRCQYHHKQSLITTIIINFRELIIKCLWKSQNLQASTLISWTIWTTLLKWRDEAKQWNGLICLKGAAIFNFDLNFQHLLLRWFCNSWFMFKISFSFIMCLKGLCNFAAIWFIGFLLFEAFCSEIQVNVSF